MRAASNQVTSDSWHQELYIDASYVPNQRVLGPHTADMPYRTYAIDHSPSPTTCSTPPAPFLPLPLPSYCTSSYLEGGVGLLLLFFFALLALS